MISHKHKCIFIHIPKCAGTSVEEALGHWDNFEGRSGQDHRSIRLIEKPFPNRDFLANKDNRREVFRRMRFFVNKRNLKNSNNRITLSKEQYDSYFKFTIVRNPWARVDSWYRNVIRSEIHREYHGITDDMSFDEFLGKFIGTYSLRTQLHWLKDFSGNIDMDYIGKFETVATDFAVISKRLGLTDLKLPHKLNSGSGGYQSAYSDHGRKLIAEHYKEEIDLFDYKFD